MNVLSSALFHQGLQFEATHFEFAEPRPYGPSYGNQLATDRLLRASWQTDTVYPLPAAELDTRSSTSPYSAHAPTQRVA